MTLSLIVAMSRNRCIGRDGSLPWHYPEDLRHFKRTTVDHSIVMGRKTWQSIGRPLPRRRSIVVSRTWTEPPPGAELAGSLDRALELLRDDDEVFVIGGAGLYRDALSRADRIYLTAIDRDVEGDVFFPELPSGAFREVERRVGETPELAFSVLERVGTGR